jgi:small-conductance mechanosensitive channel/CRP-like cAMP-binding protein
VPTHPTHHFFWAVGFLVAAAAAIGVARSRLVKRRLLFSAVLFLVSLAIHAAILEYPATREHLSKAEYLIIAFGAISGAVTLLLNPWFRDREGEGVPAIVQDSITVVLVGIASLFVFRSSDFALGITGSAVVLGFALQDTLGNAFAGLAIQIERPFRVGHWIKASDEEGRVVEITWRATKIRTKTGDLVILPNSVVAQQAIRNYSAPTVPTRLFVDVGIGYETPPNEAREAIMAAVQRVSWMVPTPPPEVLLVDFAPSSITYRVRFWVGEYDKDKDEVATSDARIAIYYELRRRNIEIPWPIQVEYSREDVRPDPVAQQESFRRSIAAVPVLAHLSEDAHRALAEAARERLFADGETIVREGDAGQSMFVVRHGSVAVTVGPERHLVAVTETGGYFGEMSLLTGDPRTATVTARGDATVLEIAASDFRAFVQGHPDVIDRLADAAALRRKQLDDARSTAATATQAERQSLALRMRQFFGLD